MAEVRYGRVEGEGSGREYPVAAAQYFHRLGGKFVYLDAGNVTLCGSGTSYVAGWANVPKCTTGYNSWKSDDTAETDSVFVSYGIDDVYEMPFDNAKNASLAASLIGYGANTIETSTTYTQIQQARYNDTDASNLLTIVGVDTDNTTVRVKIRPTKVQHI